MYSFQLNTPNAQNRARRRTQSFITVDPSTFYSTPPSSSRNDSQLEPPPLSTSTSRSILSPTQSSSTPASPQVKRRKENDNFIVYSPDQPSAPKKRKRVPSTLEKLESILRHIQSLGWSYSDYLFYSSQWKDFSRGPMQSQALEKFLSGRCQHHPGEVIQNWYSSPDGRFGDNDEAASLMWSTFEPKFHQIKNIRACLTSFAAQICIEHAVQQAKTAVKPENGLHVRRSVVTHSIAALNFALNRYANWLPVARGIFYFSTSAPVDTIAYESRTATMPSYSTLYGLLRELGMAEGRATQSAGSDPKLWGKVFFDNTQRYLRQRDMRFGREHKMTIGIAGTFLEYGEGTFPPEAHDIHDKKARVAKNERAHIDIKFFTDLINNEHLETVGALQWLDCLVTHIPQLAHYKEQVTLLYTTTAAIDRLPPTPSKIHCLSTVAKNENVTTELYSTIINFFGQIGQTKDDHVYRISPFGGDGLTYQRLLELKRYVQYNENELLNLRVLEPQLEWWHTMWTDLNRLYETHWGEPLSNDPSTLGHSSRKIGREDPSNLKKIDYYPGIQLAYLVLDARMLDCWRLAFKTSDIFGYFEDLKKEEKLPTFEDLKSMARTLFNSYSSTRAHYYALRKAGASEETSSWASSVPVGTPWLGVADDPSMEDIGVSFTKTSARSAHQEKSKPQKRSTQKDKEAEEVQNKLRQTGDRVLANSIAFMRDALLSRECANAVASGDVGRVWEVLKVWLFTFAGSSHSKYATYLLETITSLELESSKTLRDALLRTMLVNLSGRPGSFSPCDLVQEYFNRLLEFIIERKGQEFDHTFIQHIISRNLHCMSQIKLESRANVGLAPKAGRHSEPHSNPELRTLLKQYSHHELHSRRVGRYIEESDTENFVKGWSKLKNGKLAKWVKDTTNARVREDIEARIAKKAATADMPNDVNLSTASTTTGTSLAETADLEYTPDTTQDSSTVDEHADESGTEDDEDPHFRNSFGFTEVREGRLLTSTLELEQAADAMFAEYNHNMDDEVRVIDHHRL
ncbi:hypothetical protein F5880DRAFT_1492702 [Lentinula raphanica]|nr:hypothetical protein F5880DRAFT_1492702 [Lentinula raphanica]